MSLPIRKRVAGTRTLPSAKLPAHDGDALARATGAQVIGVAAGDEIRAGPLRLDILSPSPEVARLPPEGDPNNRAIVAHLCCGGNEDGSG